MTIKAQGNYVKPVLRLITFVVMIFLCLSATLFTALTMDRGEFATLDGVMNCIPGLTVIGMACAISSLAGLTFFGPLMPTKCLSSGLALSVAANSASPVLGERIVALVVAFAGLALIQIAVLGVGMFVKLGECFLLMTLVADFGERHRAILSSRQGPSPPPHPGFRDGARLRGRGPQRCKCTFAGAITANQARVCWRRRRRAGAGRVPTGPRRRRPGP